MAFDVNGFLNGVASRLVYEGSPCDRHPCWNDGNCRINGSSDYFCECSAAFVGIKCEYKVVDICQSSGCFQKDYCIAGDLKVNCTILNQNDFLSSCLTTRCLNGGTCNNSSGVYRCACPSLFHGPFCQFDSSDINYEWNALEIGIFIFIIFLIAFAAFIVCCASSNHMGFYISVPNKHYNRWEDNEDDIFEEHPNENGEQLMAMVDIKKHFEKRNASHTRGIVVSRTRETVLDDIDDTSILQL